MNELEFKNFVMRRIDFVYGHVCSNCTGIDSQIAKAKKEAYLDGINFIRENLDKVPEVVELINYTEMLKSFQRKANE